MIRSGTRLAITSLAARLKGSQGISPDKMRVAATGVSCSSTLKTMIFPVFGRKYAEEKENMKENADRNRTIRFTVRVNGKEAKWLKEAAWREKRSVADFIRSRAISGELPRIPVEVSELMKQLTYEVNRIGVNINQLVRSYHINGYHTSSEKRRLEEDLKEIRTLYVQVCSRLTEMADGSHKTPAP